MNNEKQTSEVIVPTKSHRKCHQALAEEMGKIVNRRMDSHAIGVIDEAAILIERYIAALEHVEGERDALRDFKQWYEEAISVSNEAGYVGVDAAAAMHDLVKRLAALATFKAYVHTYLDQHGVPHGDHENEHQKEGCRIGARLDLMFAERDALRKENARLKTRNEYLEGHWNQDLDR